MTNNTLLKSALWYAEHGYLVIPLLTRDKLPRIKGWPELATNDPNKIRSWWKQWPDANVGCLSGSRSGICVLDVDPRNGGDVSLDDLLQEHGQLPDTLHCLTGGGGDHYYFKIPQGTAIPTMASQIAPGIDILGDPHIVVLPPSIHPSGKTYEWEASSRPEILPIAELPRWLVAKVNTPENKGSTPIPDFIPNGTRDNTMASIAGKLRHMGMGEGDIFLTLLNVYNPKCDPPLTDKQIRKIAKSIGSKPTAGQMIEINQEESPDPKTWQDLRQLLGPIEWDWKGWLPKGLLTMIVSAPGDGKSMLALRICASYLMGIPWPDGSSFAGDPGCVLWCEAEGAQAINLDRAESWGLPIEKIYTPLDDPFSDFKLDDPNHFAALINKASRPEVKFIVVDSLRGAISGDENKSGETINNIKYLAETARDTGKPLLITHHLRKRNLFDNEEINLDRIRGSSAIIQLARVIWAIDNPDTDNKDVKRLKVIKNNLGPFPGPTGLAINNQGIEFMEAPEKPRQETIMDKSINLLQVLLKDGPVLYSKIEDEFNQAGISIVSARRAKDKLHIVSVRKQESWYWSLPVRED